jgi:DNA-binding response OmpR family regulator
MRGRDVKRILVVEDEELLRTGLCAALSHWGYDVRGVAYGADAFSAMSAVRYEVCLLDVQLPDMNGLEMLQLIRQICPAVRIVVMTALDLSDRQMAELRAYTCELLPKPFGLDTVREVVRGILGTGGTSFSEQRS